MCMSYRVSCAAWRFWCIFECSICLYYVIGSVVFLLFFFFFQAEDGIRDVAVTGVQTCALPISSRPGGRIAIRGVGRSKAVLVCLGSAGGGGRVPPCGDADLAGRRAARAPPMNLYELTRGLSLRRRPAAVRNPSSAGSDRSAPIRIPSAGVADPVAFGPVPHRPGAAAAAACRAAALPRCPTPTGESRT